MFVYTMCVDTGLHVLQRARGTQMTSLESSAPFEVRSVIVLRCIRQAICHVNFRGPSSFSFSFLHLSAEVTDLHCCAMSNFIWVLEI